MARRAFTLSVVAMSGGGKTDFLLRTCPRPLYVVSNDPNTKAVAEKYNLLDRSDVKIKFIRQPDLAFDERDDVQTEADEKWDQFRDALRPIVKGERKCRTVGIDNATLGYELGILKTFGKSDQIPVEMRRNMLGPFNTQWRGIVSSLEARGINVVLLHQAGEKWIDHTIQTNQGEQEIRKKLNGPFDIERKGYNGTSFYVSAEIFLAFDPTRDDPLHNKFGMKIVKSNARPGLTNKRYWGMEKIDGKLVRKASFPYLAKLLYPHTKMSDWE